MMRQFYFVIFVTTTILQFSGSGAQQGAIEVFFTKAVEAVNATNTMLHSGAGSIVDVVFKPLEYVGTKAEDGFVAGTQMIGKTLSFTAKKIRNGASKFQEKEEKFIGCVKTEQFDPVKKILLDISSCVSSKSDTISNIVQNSLSQVNSTYGIVKSLAALPTCEGAKCFADYTSGIFGKIGGIALGLASIGKDLTTGIASIPITLPTCLLTKPALSPVKVFGSLGINVMKCFKA